MYHVWRRDDGYVAATNSRQPWSAHSKLTLIETFEDWADAKALIEKERDTDEYRALIAKWDKTSG